MVKGNQEEENDDVRGKRTRKKRENAGKKTEETHDRGEMKGEKMMTLRKNEKE